MKKILYIVTQSEFGGAQRYIFDLATNLDKSQYEVFIASGLSTNEADAEGGLFDRLKGTKIPSHKLKHLIRSISPIADIKAYFEIKDLIKSIKPDIVHLNSSKTGVLGSLAAKAMDVPKIIYTAHGFVFNEPMSPIKRWIYKRAEISNSKRVNKIIAVSEYDRQTGIKTGIAEDKLITIHNGIDPKIEFLTKEDALLSLRGALYSGQRGNLNVEKRPDTNNKPYGDVKIAAVGSTLPRNDKIIGCIANLYHTKGLDILIQAMTKVDAQLIIIGEGDLHSELEEQIKKLNLEDKVSLTGAIPNASKYLKAFDLFVSSSRKEGLSYTILEASAAQSTIVATKVGGTPEIIQDNVNGYLAIAVDVDNLSEKINLGLQKPLPSKLDSEFELDAMIKKTIEVYSV